MALASELRSHQASCRIVLDRSALADKLTSAWNGPKHRLFSGKFRRYHARRWRDRLFDIGTLLFNLRDVLQVGVGFLQAFALMLSHRPSVIFINGGAVGVPVALAAQLLRVPYVVHESDVTPGLANRLISRRARLLLFGLDVHKAPKGIPTAVTGIPLRSSYVVQAQLTPTQAKQQLGFAVDRPLVLVTGGSQGAATLNKALTEIIEELIKTTNVIHLCGPRHEARLASTNRWPSSQYLLKGFAAEEMGVYYAAADLIVARAGATTLAELALFNKPALLVPNPLLVGGHQLKNARLLAAKDAVEVLEEQAIKNRPQVLLEAIRRLINTPSRRQRLAKRISTFAHPDATRQIAEHILTVAKN